MGQELVSTEGVFDPIRGWQFAEDNTPVAGEYRAIAIDAAGIATSHVQTLQQKLETIKANLEVGELTGLTADDLMGTLLYSTIVSYFAVNEASERMEVNTSDVVVYHRPSFGAFLTIAQSLFFLGIPLIVRFPGLEMDVDHMVNVVASRAHDREVRVSYIQHSGLRQSAYEHLIPEQLFANAANPVEAVSAVKALTFASRQGQRIYTITQDNIESAMPQLAISSDVKTKIQRAVTTGKHAIVSQLAVTVGNWTGVGYIIIDPETGSGAYLIEGEANGGILEWVSSNSTFLGFTAFAIGLSAVFAGPLVAALVVIYTAWVTFLITIAAMNEMLDNVTCERVLQCVENLSTFYGFLAALFFVIGLRAAGPTTLAIGFGGFSVISDDVFTMVASSCPAECPN